MVPVSNVFEIGVSYILKEFSLIKIFLASVTNNGF